MWELTYGQKLVGLDFNPNKDVGVQKIKELYAEIIDLMNSEITPVLEWFWSNEKNRLASIAITEAQTAQMRAVKAITWRD